MGSNTSTTYGRAVYAATRAEARKRRWILPRYDKHTRECETHPTIPLDVGVYLDRLGRPCKREICCPQCLTEALRWQRSWSDEWKEAHPETVLYGAGHLEKFERRCYVDPGKYEKPARRRAVGGEYA